jgi:concanavalin A-like lectin/glucanase superfamily protein
MYATAGLLPQKGCLMLREWFALTAVLTFILVITMGCTTPGVVSKPKGPTYNDVIIADRPQAFWAMTARANAEPDLSGNGNTGMYQGRLPSIAMMPNGDQAADFDGATQYLKVPSRTTLSIPTTRNLTVEAWYRPDVLEFPNSVRPDGFVMVLGKCIEYAPTCEWGLRMYNATTNQGRASRLSAYVFNPTGNLGAGAFWQPASGVIKAGMWLHVVGEYTTQGQPSGCPANLDYPGSIDIWVNGIRWDAAAHRPTGCMDQPGFEVRPQANSSPLLIGTMALDSWFKGVVAKVTIYDYLLSQTQINKHYQTMTRRRPTGSCANDCTF